MMTHILVVDDEPDVEILIRQKFRRQIKKQQLCFHFASQGQEALDVIKTHPEIIIMFSDINMPVMDGLALLGEVQDIEHLKTIMVTAYNDMENIRTAMNRGAYDFLTKPINMLELEHTLNKTIEYIHHIDENKKLQIEHDKMKVARDKAEDELKIKSAFFADMSHEIRTPLNAILGYCEILLEDATEDQLDSFVKDLTKIHISGDHLLKLINNILDLSKIEADRMEFFYEMVSLKVAIQGIEMISSPMMEKNQNQLLIQYQNTIDRICVDQLRFSQVFLNLLSNASKFTREGKITVNIYNEISDHDWLIVDVADTGIGMTEDQLAGLFEPFTQASKETSGKYGGTGLGLSLSKRLCQLMGGDITVVSQLGVGSAFTIKLPIENRVN